MKTLSRDMLHVMSRAAHSRPGLSHDSTADDVNCAGFPTSDVTVSRDGLNTGMKGTQRIFCLCRAGQGQPLELHFTGLRPNNYVQKCLERRHILKPSLCDLSGPKTALLRQNFPISLPGVCAISLKPRRPQGAMTSRPEMLVTDGRVSVPGQGSSLTR
ncbi:hypothetical protein RRG08_039740 [Elysia crispata]|uniref:Uncharacterized protein n=1 Tax=Elysia crispata TaxID=231223 RepID=A0AAE0YA31_9GAST|nr:hypothetical protein RRG08_039740 [Elysia crispata]